MKTVIGRALSAVVVVALGVDAALNCFAPYLMQTEIESTGFSLEQAHMIGIICAACVVLFAIPRTACLGAILISAFLGGALATHLRLGEIVSPPQIVSALLLAGTWLGLYLRDSRVRLLLS